jgi:hypothetical protein
MRQVEKYKDFVNIATEPDTRSECTASGLGFSKI